MTIDEAIPSYLLSLETLSDLIGSNLFPVRRPQESVLPAVCYSLQGYESYDELEDPGNVASTDFRIECFAGSYQDVSAIADVIRLALIGRRLDLDNEITVVSCSESDTYIPPVQGGSTGTHKITLTFTCLHDQEI